MREEWIKYKFSDTWWNSNIDRFPSITVTGHFPSQGRMRIKGTAEEVSNFIKESQSEIDYNG